MMSQANSSRDEPYQLLTTRAKIMNLSDQDALLLGLAGYAATKMWNVANHERKAVWQETEKIPGFPDQCKTLKTNRWYKLLPSQTAQEVLAELDDSYRSWYSHRKNGDLSAKPPGFRKKDALSTLTFKQNAYGMVDENKVLLKLPKTYARQAVTLEYQLPPGTTLSKVQQVKLNIRQDKDWGAQQNQELHAWPYRKIIQMLTYKAALKGILAEKVSEHYTSTTCPVCGKRVKAARVERGLFVHCGKAFNADVVGAFNILQRYLRDSGLLL